MSVFDNAYGGIALLPYCLTNHPKLLNKGNPERSHNVKTVVRGHLHNYDGEVILKLGLAVGHKVFVPRDGSVTSCQDVCRVGVGPEGLSPVLAVAPQRC